MLMLRRVPRGVTYSHAPLRAVPYRAREVGDAHVAEKMVLDEEQLPVGREEVGAHHVDLLHDERVERRLLPRLRGDGGRSSRRRQAVTCGCIWQPVR